MAHSKPAATPALPPRAPSAAVPKKRVKASTRKVGSSAQALQPAPSALASTALATQGRKAAKRSQSQPDAAPAAAARPAPPATPPKADKAPKKSARPRPQLVRDGFTMPQEDFALIGALKARTMAAQRETKKSELLRAGLRALAALDDKALLQVLGQLAPVQIGRPKKPR